MKKSMLVFCVIVLIALAGQADACTCMKLDGFRVAANSGTPPYDNEEVRKWQLEQNDYALFIGRVILIEKIKIKRSNELLPMKKVTVKVEKYWLGIKFMKPEMIIYTGVGGGDCGVPYVKGNQTFFWASRVNGLLETNSCLPYKIDEKLISEMNEAFGIAKEFL